MAAKLVGRESGGGTPEKPAAKARGGVGEKIFSEVEKLMASSGIGPTKAFRKVAKKTGKAEGAVAANYYRIANKRGKPLRSRNSNGLPDGRQIDRVLGELEELLRSQQAEIQHLRSENDKFSKVRRLLNSK